MAKAWKVSPIKNGNNKEKHMNKAPQNKNQSGFTMMELLIVLVIIGLLAALVGPSIYKRIAPAKQSATKTQLNNFMTALDNYFIDSGRYPSNSESLKALRAQPAGNSYWSGPYLKKQIPQDPWGFDYQYKTPGRNGGYEIMSYGADGAEGGEGENADINSWE